MAYFINSAPPRVSTKLIRECSSIGKYLWKRTSPLEISDKRTVSSIAVAWQSDANIPYVRKCISREYFENKFIFFSFYVNIYALPKQESLFENFLIL
jgi:hypothetical protein